ncbi:MAG: SPOR domain-containing protein, partial [Blastocatellia bacterium]
SNTYVMATPDQGNKGRLAKVFLAAALGFALLGVGYFALSGLVKDWLGLRNKVASSSPAPAASRTATGTTVPSAVPSQSAATTNGKTASPSVAASAAASASAKPAASAAATAPPATPTPAPVSKPSPPATPAVASKPTPAPATGSSGHAVGASDGSLAVQVASFKSAGEAQQALSRLKSAGVDARIVKAEVPGIGTRFRVQAGRFTNESEASKYAGELRTKGVARDFIVTGYQNQ